MQLVPVLEIRHGKIVHTEAKNNFVDEVIKEDILEVIACLAENHISRVHLVDVDAVECGEPVNVEIIPQIKAKFPEIEIQVLGGVRCIESAYIWMDAGADYLVLNGKAIRQRNLLDDVCLEFPDKILVEVDCSQGKVAMGSGEPVFKLVNLARQLEEDGVVGLVVTNVNESKLPHIQALSNELKMPVYANGGIEKTADLQAMLEQKSDRLGGILIGKALHSKNFSLNEANHLINQYQVN